MSTVIEKLNLSNFNITKNPQNFFNENTGGLYLQAEENIQEISQSALNSLLQNSDIYNNSSEYSEFLNEDIFIEDSFKDLLIAKKFIRQTFAKFKLAESYVKTDILNKLTFFYTFFHLRKVNCRFEILSSNSCKKFHFDNVQARLISTYAGPGTQLKRVIDSEFMELPGGSSVIMKGSQFKGFKPVILHRSPPIASTGVKRFLFIADY
ncbi:MAG: DUF1826 domain-containing protein [Lentisphaerales bacterium]|nr:DUF1826 domain-containing protein [Lentisphaerales bacterium]